MSKNNHKKTGFTLLEVMITLTILVTMIYTISQLLRSSVDMRLALSQKDKITVKANRILNKLSYDISHSFLLSNLDSLRTAGKGRTIFHIEKSVEGDSLRMTYQGHKPIRANSKESNLSYVVYRLKEAKKYPGRTHLYRGEFPRIPEDFKEDPPMRIFTNNVKSIKLEAWNGDDWVRDSWDSTSGDTKNKLPHMVRIEIILWSETPIEGVKEDESNQALDKYSTIVYLPNALDIDEVKERVNSLKL